MRFEHGDPRLVSAVLELDGTLLGCVVAFDEEEGWVDQYLTNSYRKELGLPLIPDGEDIPITRRRGKVVVIGWLPDLI